MRGRGFKITSKGIIDYLKEGKRFDGRSQFKYRNAEVTFGVSKWASGCVGVKLGKTEIIAGVKLDVAEPYPDHEDEGTLMTAVEFLPMASEDFEYGPPKIDAVETARVIDRGIRESKFIDFKKLCIKEGEKVWCIFIDLSVINDDGNLIDAGALAALLALKIAKMPKYDEKTETVDSKEMTDKKLLLKENMPVTITFFKVGDKFIIDPVKEEEIVSDGRATIEVSQHKGEKDLRICAMQKGGEMPFTIEDFEIIINETPEIFKNLNFLITEELKKLK